MIRVELPFHLRTLAGVAGEITLDVPAPVTRSSILDALEAAYPMLRGTIREHASRNRRRLVRFYACNEDVTHESAEKPLPEAIGKGTQPFRIVGAIAGG